MMTRIGQRRRRRSRRATSLYLSSFPFANIPFKRGGKPRTLHRFFCRELRAPERVRKCLAKNDDLRVRIS